MAKWVGASVFGGAACALYYFNTVHKVAIEPLKPRSFPSVAKFDMLAPMWDASVGFEETWMGYGLMRWWLLRYAKGDVLEISAGTGRNLSHYNLSAVRSLTLTDVSEGMLQQAEEKYRSALRLSERFPSTQAAFLPSDAHCMVAGQEQQDPAAAPSTDASAGNGQRRGFWGRLVPSAAAAAAADAPGSSGAPEPSTAAAAVEAAPSGAAGEAEGRHSSKRRRAGAGQGDKAQEESTSILPTSCSCSSGGGSRPGNSFKSRCSAGTTASGQPLARFADDSFDVVVDTFGLCSHEDPVLVLQQAARVCRPGGRILLLEHGQSYHAWLNARLDKGAKAHYDTWGCVWNRDIAAAVEEAGLQVDFSSRWHFGTSFIFIARPKKGGAPAAQQQRPPAHAVRAGITQQ